MAETDTKWRLAKGWTWRKKLEQSHPNHGKIVPVSASMRRRLGLATLLIPRPLAVDQLLRGVRKGRLITQSQIRRKLARGTRADSACPLTTGIFLRMVAEAAEEDARAGRRRITPYWRSIRDDGKLNPRFPGGVRAQAAKLRREGFTILPAKGKQPPRVKNFEKHLA